MARNPGIKFEEWVLQELETLYPDARRTKGSGAVHGDGDVHAGPWACECKDNPDQKSISVTETDWKKIVTSARLEALMPLFINKNKNGRFVTLRFEDFLSLLEELHE